MYESKTGPIAQYPLLDQVVKLIAEIVANNNLPETSTKALAGMELVRIGGSPATCWTLAFQNEKCELDVVYYPTDDIYGVCITDRSNPLDSPRLSKKVKFEELKELIHEVVLKYIF